MCNNNPKDLAKAAFGEFSVIFGFQITEFNALADITEENCEEMAAELFKGCEMEITFSCKVPFRLRLLLWYYGVRMQVKRMIFILKLFLLQLRWKITGKI